MLVGFAAWFAIAAAVAASVTLWEVLRIGRAAVVLAGATVAVADTIFAIIVVTVGEVDTVVAIVVGTAVGGVVMLATAAVVVVVAVVLTTRLTKLSTVLQVAFSVEDGMEMVVNATA